MALSKTKFKSVADKLFTKAEQGGLTVSAAFTELGEYNPVTQTQTADKSQTISNCMREEFNAYEKGGDGVQRDDFKLMVQYNSFSALTPQTDVTSVVVDGLTCGIMSVDLDAADAVYILHLRAS